MNIHFIVDLLFVVYGNRCTEMFLDVSGRMNSSGAFALCLAYVFGGEL